MKKEVSIRPSGTDRTRIARWLVAGGIAGWLVVCAAIVHQLSARAAYGDEISNRLPSALARDGRAVYNWVQRLTVSEYIETVRGAACKGVGPEY